jgi:NifU-like protein
VSFYPPKISERFQAPKNAGRAERPNAVGTGASFTCGAFVRFYLRIDVETKEILEARYKTNGCGFAIAAAEVLAEKVVGNKLTELHGLDDAFLIDQIERELEKFPAGRAHCPEISLEAVRAALADFRSFQLEEFTGERALVCTCFGVSEETVERVIADNRSETVEEVGEICKAGAGCGSCQFLIQEMIDVYWHGRL